MRRAVRGGQREPVRNVWLHPAWRVTRSSSSDPGWYGRSEGVVVRGTVVIGRSNETDGQAWVGDNSASQYLTDLLPVMRTPGRKLGNWPWPFQPLLEWCGIVWRRSHQKRYYSADSRTSMARRETGQTPQSHFPPLKPLSKLREELTAESLVECAHLSEKPLTTRVGWI